MSGDSPKVEPGQDFAEISDKMSVSEENSSRDYGDVVSIPHLFQYNISSEILFIDIDKIEPDPNQPRKFFDRDSLDSLKESIVSSSLLDPIMVRKNEERKDFYLIIDGERRWKACSELNFENSGYEKIKCVVVENDSQEYELIALTKNIHREDLLPIEKANAFAELLKTMQEYDVKFQQNDLISIVNLKKSTISEYLKISRLSLEIKEEAGKSKEWSANKLIELANIEEDRLRQDKFNEYKVKISNKNHNETVSAGDTGNLNGEGLISFNDSLNSGDLTAEQKTSRNTVVTFEKMKARLNSCENYLKKIKKRNILTASEKQDMTAMFDRIIKMANEIASSESFR
jgi:ParB/RepB/Spo0J family partition protein